MDLTDVREILTESAELLAAITGVDISTARRWKRAGKLPATAARLLSIVVLGDITVLGFTGWRILRGELISPEGWTYSPGEVMALTLLRQRVAHLEAERRKFLGLDAQPEPTENILDVLNRIVAAK
jgi:Phage protein